MSFERKNSPLMVLITVSVAQFMAPFMLTSIGVALPSLGKDLHTSAMQLGLIEQLYVVSMAMGMLTAGRFGDIVGQRKVFLPGLDSFYRVLTCSLGFAQKRGNDHDPALLPGAGLLHDAGSGSLALVAGGISCQCPRADDRHCFRLHVRGSCPWGRLSAVLSPIISDGGMCF